MTTSSSQEKGFSRVANYWPLVVSLVAVGIAWGTLTYQTNAQDQRLTKVEERQDRNDSANTVIQGQLSQIQTDIQWIKLNLKK